MPPPTEERVSQLVAGPLERRGFDLEGVEIDSSGGQRRVRLIVDRDAPADLDALAELSTEVSTELDELNEFDAPYHLEISTPGIDRPLRAPRHWRRAQGRKARITLAADAASSDTPGSRFAARVGALTGEEITLVLGGARAPRAVRIPLSDIAHAAVEVEFSPPSPRELELTGPVVPGRPLPGDSSSAPSGSPTGTVSDLREGTVE